MRIDPKGTVAGWPMLVVRRALRHLRGRLSWGLAELEAAAALNPGEGRALVKALRAERLIEAAGRGAWAITQAGQTFSSATAAKPVTRATAERALAQFLDRVMRVDHDPYFLARVTRVVLFGSMLKPEMQRLSDVDLAVELAPKEADYERARALNRQRAEELASRGHQFRNFLEVEHCWHRETFKFLKSRSRVIALADYAAEKSFILAVPHRVLIGTPEQIPAEKPARSMPLLRSRRPRGSPFWQEKLPAYSGARSKYDNPTCRSLRNSALRYRVYYDMRTAISVMVGMALAACLSAQSASAPMSALRAPIDTTLCALYESPATYASKFVRVRARVVSHDLKDLWIEDVTECPVEEEIFRMG